MTDRVSAEPFQRFLALCQACVGRGQLSGLAIPVAKTTPAS